jgi:hypothetical protein
MIPGRARPCRSRRRMNGFPGIDASAQIASCGSESVFSPAGRLSRPQCGHSGCCPAVVWARVRGGRGVEWVARLDADDGVECPRGVRCRAVGP